jgi:hypothetical protein
MPGLCKIYVFGSGLWQWAMGSLAPTLACWMSRVRQQHHQAVQDLLHQPFQKQQQQGHLSRRGEVGQEVEIVHQQLLQFDVFSLCSNVCMAAGDCPVLQCWDLTVPALVCHQKHA